jgi:lipopolysaccharide assembly outer membrane protein LptD (OstA)
VKQTHYQAPTRDALQVVAKEGPTLEVIAKSAQNLTLVKTPDSEFREVLRGILKKRGNTFDPVTRDAWMAASAPHSPSVIRFTGDVEITINGMRVRADQVDYYWQTGDIEPSGHVRLTPVVP